MARGFDSKSVSDQQEEAERSRDRPAPAPSVSPRRRTLELARLDLVRRIDAAPEPRRAALRTALTDLDELISRS